MQGVPVGALASALMTSHWCRCCINAMGRLGLQLAIQTKQGEVTVPFFSSGGLLWLVVIGRHSSRLVSGLPKKHGKVKHKGLVTISEPFFIQSPKSVLLWPLAHSFFQVRRKNTNYSEIYAACPLKTEGVESKFGVNVQESFWHFISQPKANSYVFVREAETVYNILPCNISGEHWDFAMKLGMCYFSPLPAMPVS